MTIDLFLNIMFVVVSTLMGIVIGSFLNVIIYRIPAGRTVVKGHSMCMTCGHELGALDLVPIFSWLFLGGKCRYCKDPISSRYIKIESLTGLFFLVFSLTHTGFQLNVFDPFSLPSIVYFSIYCLTLLSFAALISSMMIYHDTQKSFKGFTVFVGSIALLSLILLALTTSIKTILIFSLRAVILTLAYIVLIYVACLIFKKKYTKTDFWLDLPYAIFYGFLGFLLMPKLYVLCIAAFVLGVLPRFIIKDSKYNKFSAIIPTCGILLVTLIGYFI